MPKVTKDAYHMCIVASKNNQEIRTSLPRYDFTQMVELVRKTIMFYDDISYMKVVGRGVVLLTIITNVDEHGNVEQSILSDETKFEAKMFCEKLFVNA
jgi:hypothetical protein